MFSTARRGLAGVNGTSATSRATKSTAAARARKARHPGKPAVAADVSDVETATVASSVLDEDDERRTEASASDRLEDTADAALMHVLHKMSDVLERMKRQTDAAAGPHADAEDARRKIRRRKHKHRQAVGHRQYGVSACCRPTNRTVKEEVRCDSKGRCETVSNVVTEEECGHGGYHHDKHGGRGHCGKHPHHGKFYGCGYDYGNSCQYRRIIQPVCGPGGCVLAETNALTCNARPWWAPGSYCGMPAYPTPYASPSSCFAGAGISTLALPSPSILASQCGPPERLNGNLLGYNERSLYEPDWLVSSNPAACI